MSIRENVKGKWIACLIATVFMSVNFLYAQDYSDCNFFIKKGYISRTSYFHHDVTLLQDESQNEVYAAAHQIACKHQYSRIGDIGCGSGFKLLKYFNHCDTTGFEIQPTLNFLREKYPDKNWLPSNFSKKPYQKDFDILICSDVIEHLVNPDHLLSWINEFNFKYLVISTPDRDQLIHVWTHPFWVAQSQSGPPVNEAHVREWNFIEFENYLSQYFDVIDHFHCEKEFYGQVLIAVKKVTSEEESPN